MLTVPNRPSRPAGRAYRTSSAQRERRRKRRAHQRILTLCAAAAALIALVVILVVTLKPAPEPEPVPEAEKEYFTYWNTTFEADPGYPASTLDTSGFLEVGDRIKYLSGTVRSHAGIDVSEHNGVIDWQAVAADGVEFAMIRIGYRGYTRGGVYKDSRFDENFEGARNAGLKVGVYFFSQAMSAEEAREEAEFTLKALRGLKLDLPVAYDWELIGQENARADDIDRETLTACTSEFCSIVSRSFDAMIYTNCYQCYYYLDIGSLSDYPIWFAGYADTPALYYKYDIWQYASDGSVKGIKTPVDLNLCFFDL